jgi:hypothetical protein
LFFRLIEKKIMNIFAQRSVTSQMSPMELFTTWLQAAWRRPGWLAGVAAQLAGGDNSSLVAGGQRPG